MNALREVYLLQSNAEQLADRRTCLICICLHILSDLIPEHLDTESPPNNLIDDINTVSESKWKRGLDVVVLQISDQ